MIDWDDLTDHLLWGSMGDQFYMSGARPRDVMEAVVFGEESGLFQTMVWSVVVEAMNNPANVAAKCIRGEAESLNFVRNLLDTEWNHMVAAWVGQYQHALGV